MAKKKVDFEAGLSRLKAIVAELESGELSLEEGVSLFKEGAFLVKQCRKQLETARHEVQILTDDVFTAFKVEADNEQ